MINLLYLGLAIFVSIVASVVLLMRNRRPRSVEAGIDEFSRELKALAPGPAGSRPRRGRETRSG